MAAVFIGVIIIVAFIACIWMVAGGFSRGSEVD
jgi:hypothetical protein